MRAMWTRLFLVLLLALALPAGGAPGHEDGRRSDIVTTATRIPVGVVEGFYGRPWTHEDRLSIIHFMGGQGLNHFCYAPKDDPYHRDKWREAYPPEVFARILELHEACAAAGVEFCFAISPGLDIEYSSDAEFARLCGKLRVFFDKGVRHFALFLDDVHRVFRHEADAKRYGSFGEAHADLTNRVFDELRRWSPDTTLIFCPTDYHLAERTPYLKALCAQIHREVPIVWTGMGVVSTYVTPANLLLIRTTTGGRPFLWDNYPVNDYDYGHLFLGPIRNRSPRMLEHLSGYWSNPMNEAELSKIPLWTIADYLRDPAGYDADRSWDQAIRAVGGEAAYPEMRLMCELCMGSRLNEEEAPSLALAAADYLNRPTSATAAQLRAEIARMKAIEPALRDKLPGKRMFRELRPSLKKLRRHVENLETALALAESDVDSGAADELRARLAEGLRAVDTVDSSATLPGVIALTQEQYDELLDDDGRLQPANVADELFASIIQELRRRDLIARGLVVKEVVCAVPPFQGRAPENAVDGDGSTFYRSARGFRRGEMFMVDFGTTQPAQSAVSLRMASEQHPEEYLKDSDLEVSADGAAWQKLADVDEAEVVAVAPKAFRYVRVVPRVDHRPRLIIRELDAGRR